MGKLRLALTDTKKRESLSIRLSKYIDVKNQDDCWPWIGTKNKLGYGRTSAGRKMHFKAHRVPYCIAFNIILEDDVCVLHDCDNPSCCNPYHLFTGTKKDNTQDMLFKNRGVRPPIAYGESHHNTKITQKNVFEILNDKITYKEIAKEYSISTQTVFRIKKGQTWKLLNLTKQA